MTSPLLLAQFRFAAQADLWIQDDDLVLQKYSHLSVPAQQDNSGDVFGVTAQSASRSIGLQLDDLAPTYAGVYGAEEMLAGCASSEERRVGKGGVGTWR